MRAAQSSAFLLVAKIRASQGRDIEERLPITAADTPTTQSK
jgi:hypothetical protein